MRTMRAGLTPRELDVDRLELAILILAGSGELKYSYSRPLPREARRIAYRISAEYARLAAQTKL